MTARRTRYQAIQEQSLKQKCDSLYKMVSERNIAKATGFLKAGAKPDYIYLDDNMGFTPFHAALPRYEGSNEREEEEQQIHIDLLNLLISNKYNSSPEKLNIFSEDVFGYNPFEWAIADGKKKCVHWFLNLLNKKSFKSIANTIINRQNTLESTVKPFKQCKRVKNQTPIQLAVKSENLNIVKQLTAFTPRPNVGICDDNNMNAIHLAIAGRLPEILYQLVNISTINDLNIVNNNNDNALAHSEKMYQESLINAVTPTDILQSWQCKEIISARLAHSLSDKWEDIKKQQAPTHNAGMVFWKFTQEKNPNTNILKTNVLNVNNNSNNVIHNDIKNICNNLEKKNKYRIVSFKEACKLQHNNPKWITNFNGKLNVNERYENVQRLSPFAKNLKRLFVQQRKQLNCTYKPTENEKIKKQRFLYEPTNKWIEVEAINESLDKELTLKDRIQFYEMSIGKYKDENGVEIREINDITHPCKRYNNSATFGLFATKNIPKKTIIIEYTGLVCTENEYTASLGHDRLEKFDAQWRSFEFETFKSNESYSNRLLLDAGYYSNESVFVNDATYDSVFDKWSVHNVSFFEIRINGWPHSFLRAYNDIEKGEELLASYGRKFWDEYKRDMKVSASLNKYYMNRLRRDKEVVTKKRKRSDCDLLIMDEPMNKKRKVCSGSCNGNLKEELESMDCKLNELISDLNNKNNNSNSNVSMQKLVGYLGGVFSLWKNSELRHKKQSVIITDMEERFRDKLERIKGKLDEKDGVIEILESEVNGWRNNDKIRKEKLNRLSKNMCEIISDVELMNEKKDEEIERLKEENRLIQNRLNECVVKKQKYKKLLLRERQQKNK